MSDTFIPQVTTLLYSKEMVHDDARIEERHREIFSDLANFFNKNVIINYNNGTTDNGSRNNDINVCLWSAHKDAEMCFPEVETAFGYKFCTDGVFVPKQELINIAGLVEYDESLNKIFFTYDVCELRTEEEYSLMEKLIDELMVKIAGSAEEVDKRINTTLERITVAKMNILANQIMSTESSRMEDRKRRIAENKNRLEEARRNVRQLILQINTDEGSLNGGQSAIERIKGQLAKELDIMKSNKKVKRIDIDTNGKINIYTDVLYSNVQCPDGKNRKYKFGRYNICVNISNGDVKFFNLDEENKRKSYWGAKDNHPHVSHNGSPCLGSAGSLIADCVDQYQWGVLADVLINYLESVNLGDPAGKNFWRWDEIDKDGNVVEKGKYKLSSD